MVGLAEYGRLAHPLVAGATAPLSEDDEARPHSRAPSDDEDRRQFVGSEMEVSSIMESIAICLLLRLVWYVTLPTSIVVEVRAMKFACSDDTRAEAGRWSLALGA